MRKTVVPDINTKGDNINPYINTKGKNIVPDANTMGEKLENLILLQRERTRSIQDEKIRKKEQGISDRLVLIPLQSVNVDECFTSLECRHRQLNAFLLTTNINSIVCSFASLITRGRSC